VLLGLVVGCLASCGPSVQTIYEGNLRFEHCYRLDLDARTATGHRHVCWQRWLDTYSFGQARDRIEYARRRVRSIEGGDVDRPRLNVDSEPRQARQFYLSVPEPTNAHSPPPPIATHFYGSKQPSADDTAPGDACAARCRAARSQCLKGCPAQNPESLPVDAPPDAAVEPAGSGAGCLCDGDYRTCVRRCFEGD
jgi:hypothetical protein